VVEGSRVTVREPLEDLTRLILGELCAVRARADVPSAAQDPLKDPLRSTLQNLGYRPIARREEASG
jgi:hypothetical protein